MIWVSFSFSEEFFVRGIVYQHSTWKFPALQISFRLWNDSCTLWNGCLVFGHAANQRAPEQSQLDDCTRLFPWGLLSSSLSRQTPVRWHAAELTAKLRLTDRLLAPMRTYYVLYYLLLEPHWSLHPPSQRFIFVRCIAAHRRAELYFLAMMLPYFQH